MAGGHGTLAPTNPNNIDIPDILFRRERGTHTEKKKEIKIRFDISYLVPEPHSSVIFLIPIFQFSTFQKKRNKFEISVFYLCVCWQLICEVDRE